MSFILDALKKSETERQEQGSAEFVNVPTSTERREGPPAWLWVLGALLLVNLVVLAGIMMQPGTLPATSDAETVGSRATPPVETVPDSSDAIAPEPERADDDFADRLAAVREAELPREEPTPASVGTASAAIGTEEPPTGSPAPPRSTTATNTAALPTIHEVMANGLVNVGALHVDIHVFAENAADRFVFINMAKYNEGARLAEGPLVEEITVDGVVLSHNGTTFLLPRD